MKQVYLLILFVSISYISYSQDIKGVVVDEQGVSLPGVNVHATQSNTFTSTDLDGKFLIKANIGEILEFTMMGMESTKVAASASSMKIILKTGLVELNETVVVGYGSKKKGSITGSVVQVKAQDITQTPSQSAIQSIQGKAAGVNIVTNDEPGQNPSIRIRGLGTVLGGRDPLYIIDGVEASSLNGLSPNEIEKIDVLKDASSLAIYGQKGANGVIVVSTKKGKSGSIQVNYDSYFSLKTIQKKVKMSDAYHYAYYNNSAMGSSSYYSFDQPYNTDWLDEITSTGMAASNYVSMSGGNEYANYYLGLTDLRETGILNGSAYKRKNISSRNEFSLWDKRVKIQQNLNISVADNKAMPLSAFTNAYKQAPIMPVYWDNGRWGIPLMNSETGLPQIDGDDKFNNVGNPVAQLHFTDTKSQTVTIFGSLAGEAKITENISFHSNFGMTYETGKSYNFNDNMNNWLAQNPTSEIADYEATFGDKEVIYNQLSKTRWNSYLWNWDNYFAYHRSYNGQDFNFTLGVTESTRNNYESLTGNRYNVPAQSNYWSLNLSTYNTELAPGEVASNYLQTPVISLAYFARFDYSKDDKYLISGSLRREGVSSFLKEQRWGYFPALSVGWVISREAFMDDNTLFDLLKFRLGYGEVGNSNTGNALNKIAFSTGTNYTFGTDQAIYPGSMIPYQVDPALTWETMKEFDAGFDFAFSGYALTGTLEFYNRLSTDIILPVTLPAVLSPGAVYLNTGTVVNRGIELSLSYQKKISEASGYRISGNLAYNYNQLKDVSNAYFANFIGGNLGNGQWTKQVLSGESLGSFYVYEVLGFNDDREFIYSDARVVAGSYLPSVTGGVNATYTLKNWDFSAVLYGAAGNKVYNGKKAQRFGGENVEYDINYDLYSPANPDGTSPKPFNDVPLASTYYLEDASFLRLNNLTAAYNFEKPFRQVGKIRIYASVVNLYTLTAFSGFSPEIVGGDNANPLGNAGIELDAYPTNRSYILGINVEF